MKDKDIINFAHFIMTSLVIWMIMFVSIGIGFGVIHLLANIPWFWFTFVSSVLMTLAVVGTVSYEQRQFPPTV